MKRGEDRMLRMPGKCSVCGGPLLTPQTAAEDKPYSLRVCAECVVRALATAAVAIWGDFGDRPGSRLNRGHGQRMAAHEARVRIVAEDVA